MVSEHEVRLPFPIPFLGFCWHFCPSSQQLLLPSVPLYLGRFSFLSPTPICFLLLCPSSLGRSTFAGLKPPHSPTQRWPFARPLPYLIFAQLLPHACFPFFCVHNRPGRLPGFVYQTPQPLGSASPCPPYSGFLFLKFSQGLTSIGTCSVVPLFWSVLPCWTPGYASGF